MAQSTLAAVLPIRQLIAFIDQRFRPLCSYEYPETFTGAADAQPCGCRSTVSDIETGLPYCARHAQEVMR